MNQWKVWGACFALLIACDDGGNVGDGDGAADIGGGRLDAAGGAGGAGGVGGGAGGEPDLGQAGAGGEEADAEVTPDLGPDEGLPPDAGVDAEPDAAEPDVGPDMAMFECLPDETRDCPAELGCAGGTQGCVDGAWGPCVGPEETCDGLDNDCDDAVDEGFDGLGDACSVGVGACAADGVIACTADGSDVACAAVALPPSAEECDGIDNDCDGEIDGLEPRPCYEGPDGTEGVGACRAGTSACVDGVWAPCADANGPAEEQCDGVDSDCDGVVDEGEDGPLQQACFSGPAPALGQGPCMAGVQVCADGVFGACDGEVLPGNEICDGADNDCDGVVDDELDCACLPQEQQDCYSGPEGTAGVGACQAGRQTCLEDGSAFGACLQEIVPEAEGCDGVDSDCDGTVDEEVPGAGEVCTVGVGACAVEGTRICDGDAGEVRCDAVAGEPGEERCTGLDDDCDGTTDEGFGLGEECVVGLGACRARGQRICDGEGGTTCSAEPGPSSDEVCDNLDNDCDGQTDEGLGLGDECTVGVGACARTGALVCGEAGRVICSVAPGQPGEEACNAQDDDCDGQVDEENPGGGDACDTGLAGVCAAGTRVCNQGAFDCAQAVQASDEVCDGLDNDCDGVADNDGEGPVTTDCYEGPDGTEGVGECTGGIARCVEGEFGACEGQVVPGAEVCDTLDNDCNGAADDIEEGECVCIPGERRDCYTGPDGTEGVGVCAGGSQGCLPDGSGYGPCEGQVVPGAEICNEADDDCDGVVDNPPRVGNDCQVGVGACRADGTIVCDLERGVVCDAVPGEPVEEVCDGVDNDCNEAVDDVAGLGDECTNGVGACVRPGNLVCDRERQDLVCNAQPGAPQPEVCDAEDNDCDEAVDEGELPRVGEACEVSFEACTNEGQLQCAAGQITCDAPVPVPVEETCDGDDNDCDGVADEGPVDIGADCEVSTDQCTNAGNEICVDGDLVCDAAAPVPRAERCNDRDDDCDGEVDEGDVCVVYRSCQTARRLGRRDSGVYRLQPTVGGEIHDVWCDQQTDGGGWTLVGSTRTTTMNDQRSDYYADLATLMPAEGHDGVWDGMRPLGRNFDVRFTCRRDGGAAEDAAMDVDLSFYNVIWYDEFTTGTDAESCFSESNGRGDDPPPARRDNVAGQSLPAGNQWQQGYLEGEDSCGDTGDFTVDFDDRGMDSNQSDGTDWGEDDTFRKCGQSGLQDGQWFIFARETADFQLAGQYVVSDGPRWSDEGVISYSCQEACALLFSGRESTYQCSTNGEQITNTAWMDGWGDQGRFCGANPAPEDFRLPEGDNPLYDCGADGCSYSAYVDDHGCNQTNYCWVDLRFAPPDVGQAGNAGVIDGDPWTVCRADDESAWVAANDGGTYNAVTACQSLGYETVEDWGGTGGTVCGYSGTPGRELYDGQGGDEPTFLSITVHWLCARNP